MATVAIVHAGEDTLPARALAEKLRAIQLTPVLEKGAGDELRNAVKDATVTIALWSPRSVGQQALVDDVAFARGKSKVVHATMQNAAVPDAFRNEKNTVNLTGWRGEDDFEPWRELAKLVTKQAGVPAPPPPAPKPPSGFFQPGRPMEGGAAPPPRGGQASRPTQARPAQSAPQARQAPRAHSQQPAAEKRGGGAGMIIGIVAAVLILGGGGAGYWFWSQSQNSSAAATAWDNVERNDASALRAFLDGAPGEYRDEAEAALAELEERTYEAASDSDTIEAFEAFLNDFPQSEHALAARGRIAELQAQPAPPEVPAAELPENEPSEDLVPPGVTTPPANDGGGPAQLTPPGEPTNTDPPDDAPTN